MVVKLVTVPEMLEIERAADASGLSYDQMMENAGAGLAEGIRNAYSHMSQDGILGLVGRGNNGGDALVALALLASEGWKTSAYVVGPRPENDPLVESYESSGGKITLFDDDSRFKRMNSLIKQHSLLLDGLLGTGIRLPLRDPMSKVLKAVQRAVDKLEQPPVIIAVDCPSGIDCDTGEAASECLSADLTVCMAAVKRGMLRFPAFGLLGDLMVVSIGLPEKLKPWKAIKRVVVDDRMVKEALPERPLDAHKGTFGTVLVVAGSVNYTGAALLAGEAAYRVGAGLVTLAVPAPLHHALAGQFPEATWLILPHEAGVIASGAEKVIIESLDRVTTLLVGPGFGLEDTTQDFLARLFSIEKRTVKSGMGFLSDEEKKRISTSLEIMPPLVVDADGLKLLAGIEGWAKMLPPDSILTPHPGEMAILTGLEKDEIQANRIEIAEKFAKKWGHVVVLKGAFTVIASSSGRTAILPVATPALARAGTGDVLAGIIAGLRAQGVDAFTAAGIGAWIHAQTGLAAARNLGGTASVLAGDLLSELPEVMGSI